MEIPAWIEENPSILHPTEIFVPLSVKVGPVWSHNEGRGGWYGAVVIDVPLDVADLWDCDHMHADPAEALQCGHDAARQLAETIIAGRQR